MKVVTSITTWNDAVGKRVSITYSEIDESGNITSDNNRTDRVVTDSSVVSLINELMDYAQTVIGE